MDVAVIWTLIRPRIRSRIWPRIWHAASHKRKGAPHASSWT